jgi:inner membrane protein
MDTLTHIAVGALMGEVYAGKQLGKRAMLIGAGAQSLPDIDVVASFWLPPAENLLAHRGLTHSILFGIVATLILTWLLERKHRTFSFSLLQWCIFFGSEIFMHLFLDAFNSYGIGWLEPFNHIRISFNTLFVVDPLFSFWPGIACVVIIFMKRHNTLKVKLAWAALIIAFSYLGVALLIKNSIRRIVDKNLISQRINAESYFTTPTAFNSLLWYVVIKNNDGFSVGFHSILDHTDSIPLTFFPQHADALESYRERKDIKSLLQFSQGYFTIQNNRDTLLFNDLRFGQIRGWQDPAEKFVFHYYINDPDNNVLVVQRGRAADWNKNSMRSLFKRMKGK